MDSGLNDSLVAFILPLVILSLANSNVRLSVVSSFRALPFLLLNLPFNTVISEYSIEGILVHSSTVEFKKCTLLTTILSTQDGTAVALVTVCLIALIVKYAGIFDSISRVAFVSCFISGSSCSGVGDVICNVRCATKLLVPLTNKTLCSIIPVKLLTLVYTTYFLLDTNTVLLVEINSSGNTNKLENPIPTTIQAIVNSAQRKLSCLGAEHIILCPLILTTLFGILAKGFRGSDLIVVHGDLEFASNRINLIVSIATVNTLTKAFVIGLLGEDFGFRAILVTGFLIRVYFHLLFITFNGVFTITTALFIISLYRSILGVVVVAGQRGLIRAHCLKEIADVCGTILVKIGSLNFVCKNALSGAFNPEGTIL